MDAPDLDTHHARVDALTGGLCRPGGLSLTDRALALCRLASGARVLDVGCGSGVTVRHLLAEHRLRAVGLDRSADVVDRVRHGCEGWPFIQATAQHLPLPDASLDAVLAECVLSTLTDPAPALAEFARVLGPGGHLVVTDVYARGPTRIPGMTPRGEILDGVRGLGFEITAWQDHSDTLRDLAISLIWAYGPAARLWPWCGSADHDTADSTHPSARRTAGYFLLVARKDWRVHHGRP